MIQGKWQEDCRWSTGCLELIQGGSSLGESVGRKESRNPPLMFSSTREHEIGAWHERDGIQNGAGCGQSCSQNTKVTGKADSTSQQRAAVRPAKNPARISSNHNLAWFVQDTNVCQQWYISEWQKGSSLAQLVQENDSNVVVWQIVLAMLNVCCKHWAYLVSNFTPIHGRLVSKSRIGANQNSNPGECGRWYHVIADVCCAHEWKTWHRHFSCFLGFGQTISISAIVHKHCSLFVG